MLALIKPACHEKILGKAEKVFNDQLGLVDFLTLTLDFLNPHPEIYITTHWLPKEVTGTGSYNLIEKSQAKTCISYLLAMLEYQILVPRNIMRFLYTGHWWLNQGCLWDRVQERSKIYKF